MHIKELKSGFREAKKITKKFAKTFYLSSYFLPKDKKHASYAVYAICRLSDESVDEISYKQKDSLKKIEQNISTAYSQAKINEPLLIAFRDTIENYKIPKEYFDKLIEGMRMDLEIKKYSNFSELKEYCYKVAGVIGLIMLKIFGYKDKIAEDYAIKLGIAMQLTNILRDISEDFARGRIYLPQEEMLRFDVSEDQLAAGQNNTAFKNLICFQIERCRKLYNECLPGVKLINNQSCRFVVLAMKEIYAGILDSIIKNRYDVFTKRPYVSKLKKIKIIFSILVGRSYL